MDVWFFREPSRLAEERAAIQALVGSAPWLVGVEWLFDPSLCLDAVIRAHGIDYQFRVEFPSFYPEVPAAVRPRNQEHRLSQHQYGGADGPLCLEWGPDNWHRGVTAANLLESTYRLLEIENPLGQHQGAEAPVAPSRHQLSIGQELRGKTFRWYRSHLLEDQFLGRQVAETAGGLVFSFRDMGECWTTLVHEARAPDGALWKDERVPESMPGASKSDWYSGVWLKTEMDGSVFDNINKLDDLRRLAEPLGVSALLATDGSSPIEGFNRSIAGILLVGKDLQANFFIVLGGNSLYRCVSVVDSKASAQQRSTALPCPTAPRVGIVGAGSAGSKIAITLARLGLKRFYIVDHDVLLPENLVRHALDWQHVTRHKANALAAAIQWIEADAQVEVSSVHLTGQESNAVVAGVAQSLGTCDLIIDATARPRVFNLLAAVARIAEKPLVWLQVFGGGVGGLIGRSRPGLDPSPHEMRAAYLAYCNDNPAPPGFVGAEDYLQLGADDEVLAASDVDVGLIALHAARFAVDCFALPAESQYPHSLYLVGLSKAWVFRAPFDTIPIGRLSLRDDLPGSAMALAEAEFLQEMLSKPKNEAPPS